MRFDVIAPMRGLPDDLSHEVAEWIQTSAPLNTMTGREYIQQRCYPSWLTLSERLSFDWYGKTIIREALVAPTVAHLLMNKNLFLLTTG